MSKTQNQKREGRSLFETTHPANVLSYKAIDAYNSFTQEPEKQWQPLRSSGLKRREVKAH